LSIAADVVPLGNALITRQKCYSFLPAMEPQ
jgi:hypothetical protein